MSIDKELLRTVKARTEENIIPYVSAHNHRDPEIFRVIIDNYQFYKKMMKCETFYPGIKSKRANDNLITSNDYSAKQNLLPMISTKFTM